MTPIPKRNNKKMNMKFETHKTNKYKIHLSFHTTPYASTPLELLYIFA
jgi:hypothetical protein